MSRLKHSLVLAFLALLSLDSAHPQASAAPESPALTGTVTGFVYYSETRLPVRFAEINLVPIPSMDAGPAQNQPIPTDGVPQQRERRVQRAYGTSGMDGSFRLNVPEGNYFVAALKPGYITPGAAEAMDSSLSDDQRKSHIASLPQVHVGSGGTATMTLTLQRGAVISGRMRFADGSPVIGATVRSDLIDSFERFEIALHPENRSKAALSFQEALQSLFSSQQAPQRLTTDDEGRYRLAGLWLGKYLVSTTVLIDHGLGRVVMNYGPSPHSGREHMYPEMISVYAPTTFRRKDAKVFEISGDEQIVDADLTIDPNGLHTLRGRVLAADHHAPNTMIRFKEEGAKEVPRLVEIEDDGTFQVDYLPSGKYALQILSSDAPDPAGAAPEPKEYKMVELTTIIADQDVQLGDVLLVPLKPGERNRFDLLF